jgi:hypothetical protein
MTFNHGDGSQSAGLCGEINAVAAQVCVALVVLMALLAWTIRSSCCAFLLAMCTGVSVTTTAAAMATTLSSHAHDQQQHHGIRTASASLAEKEAKGCKQKEKRQAILFIFFAALSRLAWSRETERFHAPLPWETTTARYLAGYESKGACALTSWLGRAWPHCV